MKPIGSPSRGVASSGFLHRAARAVRRRPELAVFALALAACNWTILGGAFFHPLIFLPPAVAAGQWWRLFTHPFVHVTWYHLLLDGSAFFMLYAGLTEARVLRRLSYVLAAGAGSLLLSWCTEPRLGQMGLCGLSGIAHGLTAVSGLELMQGQAPRSSSYRLGLFTLALVLGKAALEAVSGRMFFAFLHFGLMGDPVAVSHAGGVIGALVLWLGLNLNPRPSPRPSIGTAQPVLGG